MKKCPFCAEDIQDAAIFCKHCRRDLPSAARQASGGGTIPGIVLEENLGQAPAAERPAAVTSLRAPLFWKEAVQAPGPEPPTHPAVAKSSLHTLKTFNVTAWTLMGFLFMVVVVVALMNRASLDDSSPRNTSTKSQESGSASLPPSQPATAPQQESLEYKLAMLNHGGYVAHDDVTVARFRFLLGQLSTKYGETQVRIGGMSAKGRDMLADKGVAESLLNIMESMNQIVDGPGSYGKDPYANFLTLYVALRASGKSHEFAINNLTGVVREVGVK